MRAIRSACSAMIRAESRAASPATSWPAIIRARPDTTPRGVPSSCAIPEASLPYLSDLDLWIVDALKRTPHPSHFCLDDTLRAIARFKPQRAILTNMHVDMDYDTLRAELPAGVEPAYDGLKLPL